MWRSSMNEAGSHFRPGRWPLLGTLALIVGLDAFAATLTVNSTAESIAVDAG